MFWSDEIVAVLRLSTTDTGVFTVIVLGIDVSDSRGIIKPAGLGDALIWTVEVCDPAVRLIAVFADIGLGSSVNELPLDGNGVLK